jgi:YidC/Oxa1 family membrane protein insertase
VDFQRLFLFLIFSISLFLLWDGWQRAQHPVVQGAAASSSSAVSAAPASASNQETAKPSAEEQLSNIQPMAKPGKKFHVTTDVLSVEINTVGGDIQQLEFLKHRAAADNNKPLILLQKHGSHTYITQSGLLSGELPTHNTEFASQQDDYQLAEGKDDLQVNLLASTSSGVRVTKTYTFHRGSYQVDIAYDIQNDGTTPISPSAYFQLVRDSSKPEGDSKFVPTYVGPAVYTDASKFQKVDFSHIEKNKTDYPKTADNGWIAMLQHYFVAAWLPKDKAPREYYTKQLDKDLFAAGVILPIPTIEPGKSGGVGLSLYAGPAQSSLDHIAPGLGLTVDYGWLTIVATPLFWLLSMLQGWVQNWGVAIILLTVLIKLAFFPLSAASYRSMAKMRVMAPKLERLKQQYAEDRERLHKAMMELYKTEKINPMGGCLPILLQIPVFMALYWAILYSVELRHAPFFGWIEDLSSPDPYYVLPLIMGASMLLQSKLNPKPADPMQAKIMQTMPIVFSVMFFFFPAGLVLYSVVNNMLSIAQQWYITRGAEKTQTKGAS